MYVCKYTFIYVQWSFEKHTSIEILKYIIHTVLPLTRNGFLLKKINYQSIFQEGGGELGKNDRIVNDLADDSAVWFLDISVHTAM